MTFEYIGDIGYSTDSELTLLIDTYNLESKHDREEEGKTG